MADANRYELSSDAVLQVADGEALLVKLNDEEMYALNETGAAIVQRIADGQTVDALIDELVQTYGADRADVARDVIALIRELVERGLLVAVGGKPLT